MAFDRALIDKSLDALDDVFYIYDEHARLVYWNDRLNAEFGLSDEELHGMAPTDFFYPEDRPAIERAVGELFETGKTVVDARADTVRGLVRFELTGTLLTDDDGRPIGFSGTGRDVTETRDTQRRLTGQNKRLDEFVSVVAHDLRNPLAVIDGSLELAAETGDPAHLARCREAVQRTETLIEDLLTLARRGEWVESQDSIDLAAFVRRCWEDTDTPEATLYLDTERTITADHGRLAQLLGNLFRNALEHAGPAVTVTVGDIEGGFFVADDGPGVDGADFPSLFESGYTTTDGGTGLGLNIVKQIANAHGWNVAAAESAAGGLRVEITGVAVEA